MDTQLVELRAWFFHETQKNRDPQGAAPDLTWTESGPYAMVNGNAKARSVMEIYPAAVVKVQVMGVIK